jgi:hypothetical protein
MSVASSRSLPRAIQTIVAAGLICGVLDGISALILSELFGGQPIRVFQGIASGILGRNAFNGGLRTVAIGVALHFLIAFGAAIVYYAASLRFQVLIDQAVLSGVLYGIAVHLFMTFIVIPLSAIGGRPIVPLSFAAILMVHMMVVGPSIALTVRWYSRGAGRYNSSK